MISRRLRLETFLPYRLSVTSNLVSGSIAATYEALFGLDIPEWRVIAVVAERDGLTQQELCSITRMDKVTVSRAAIALSQRGLIERRPNSGDRRSYRLALTPAGERLYSEVAPMALKLEQRIFSQFAAEEIATLTDMLKRIETVVLRLEDERE